MKKILIALVLGILTLLILCGCESRQPVVTITPSGTDVACTAADFDLLTAAAVGPHLEPYGEGEQREMETNPEYFQHGKAWFTTTLGLYDETSNTVWYVCRDPAHPTAEELLRRQHEWCHRADHLQGWTVSGPMWAHLPKRLRTHPEIEVHLIASGLVRP